MEHINFGSSITGGRSSQKYVEITCSTCGTKAMKRSDFVDNVKRSGRKIVCSRLCAVPHRKPSVYKSITLKEYAGKNRTGVCRLCDVKLPINEFIKDMDNKHQKFRKSWFCSKCRVIRTREYMLKRQYNMKSIDEYDQMIREQRNLCAVCKKEMVRPCIDHNHTTGQVRKLLCVQCNSMLGNAYENIETLQSAIVYLKEWKTK